MFIINFCFRFYLKDCWQKLSFKLVVKSAVRRNLDVTSSELRSDLCGLFRSIEHSLLNPKFCLTS